ncbi:MAG: zinc ribbon domain-containing protein [Firmicutes bacterium]|nr:zinc ribbon domain-containing protein [Bacillota bacterium]
MKQRSAFCGNCGEPVVEGASFCEACGYRLESAPPGSVDSAEVSKSSDAENPGHGNILEIWRRTLLALMVCAAVWLIFYASLAPLLAVRPVDFVAEKKELAQGYLGFGFLTDEEEQLSRLPLDQYIAEVTRGKLVTVEGEQWAAFFSKVTGTLNGTVSEREWKRRLGEEYSDVVYFGSGEAPLNRVAGTLNGGSELYLDLGGVTPPQYLLVQMKKYANDDFRLGTGVHGPPAFILYPYRQSGFWLAWLGLGIYVLLPWPKKRAEIISYQRWRVVLGDFLALVLLVMFFSLPLFVVGNSVQAVTAYWPLTIIMWLMALMAIFLLKITTWQAALQIEMLPDRLVRITARNREEYPYADMNYIQPAILVPPRWLVVASWLGALAGRTPLAAGNAMILSSSEYGGLRIVNKDGRALNIWFTDQLGNIALPGYERIPAALENAGVEVKREPIKIQGLGLE